MKKLSKEQLKERERLLGALSDEGGNLEAAIIDFNATMEKMQAKVESQLEKYNEVLADVRSLAEEVASDALGYFEDRSEKWQESDTGRAYIEWYEQWQNAELDDEEIEFPQPLEVPDVGAAVLEDLPDQFEE